MPIYRYGYARDTGHTRQRYSGFGTKFSHFSHNFLITGKEAQIITTHYTSHNSMSFLTIFLTIDKEVQISKTHYTSRNIVSFLTIFLTTDKEVQISTTRYTSRNIVSFLTIFSYRHCFIVTIFSHSL